MKTGVLKKLLSVCIGLLAVIGLLAIVGTFFNTSGRTSSANRSMSREESLRRADEALRQIEVRVSSDELNRYYGQFTKNVAYACYSHVGNRFEDQRDFNELRRLTNVTENSFKTARSYVSYQQADVNLMTEHLASLVDLYGRILDDPTMERVKKFCVNDPWRHDW
jgi:hypothetical protein